MRQFVPNLHVLDAGCGLGYGLDILATSAASVRGQDVDPQLADGRIIVEPLTSLPTGSFDAVVAVDVIEHIRDDAAFMRELARIARTRVLLTTPNWTAGRCTWPYHVREYTPAELRALCQAFGACQLWKGTPDGSRVFPIRHTASNDLFNRARVQPVLGQLARVVNAIVPAHSRIHSHLAAVIDLRPTG
jgi:2-polyprenyl-3-methyl-5-hydroxy-6-metoxy-1,4-benzoquinol methylase